MTNPEDAELLSQEASNNNIEKNNEKIQNTEEIDKVIAEVLKKAENDFNNIQEVVETAKEELASKNIEVPEEIEEITKEAIRKFEKFKEDTITIENSIINNRTFKDGKVNIENSVVGDIKKVDAEILKDFIKTAMLQRKGNSPAVIMAKNEINRRTKNPNIQRSTSEEETLTDSKEIEALKVWKVIQKKKKGETVSRQDKPLVEGDTIEYLKKSFQGIAKKPWSDDFIDENFRPSSEDKTNIKDKKRKEEEAQKNKRTVEEMEKTQESVDETEDDQAVENFISEEAKKNKDEKLRNNESKNLSVDEIIENINERKEIGEADEKILREEIERIVLEKKKQKDEKGEEIKWSIEESEMMSAYIKEVNRGHFKDGNLTIMNIDFDAENIEFNRSTEEKKEEKISEKKKEAKEKLKKQNINVLLEDMDINTTEEEIKAEQEAINRNIETLKEELREQIEEEKNAHNALTEEHKTSEFFSEKGRKELKKIILSLKKSNQLTLNMERLEYYQLASNDSDLKFLIEKHHTEKDYTIRILEQTVEAIEKIEKILEKKDDELTEKDKHILDEIYRIMKKNPKMTIGAVLALLVSLGLITFGPEIIAGLAAKGAGEKIAEGIITEAGKKVITVGLGVVARGIRGGLIGAGILGVCALFNQKRRDGIMKILCGTDLPSWANEKEEK